MRILMFVVLLALAGCQRDESKDYTFSECMEISAGQQANVEILSRGLAKSEQEKYLLEAKLRNVESERDQLLAKEYDRTHATPGEELQRFLDSAITSDVIAADSLGAASDASGLSSTREQR